MNDLKTTINNMSYHSNENCQLIGCPICHSPQLKGIKDFMAEIVKLQAENKVMREALEFIANDLKCTNYVWAREALSKVSKEEK